MRSSGRKRVLLSLLALLGVVVIGFIQTFEASKRRQDQFAAMQALFEGVVNDRSASSSSMRGLRSKLVNGNEYERATAASFLGRLGPMAAPCLGELESAIIRDKPVVAREAAMAIERMGPIASSSTPTLLLSLQRYADKDVGWFSARALGAVADPDAVAVHDALVKAAATTNVQMAANARIGLERFDSRKKRNGDKK
jgi:hypothetical protein